MITLYEIILYCNMQYIVYLTVSFRVNVAKLAICHQIKRHFDIKSDIFFLFSDNKIFFGAFTNQVSSFNNCYNFFSMYGRSRKDLGTCSVIVTCLNSDVNCQFWDIFFVFSDNNQKCHYFGAFVTQVSPFNIQYDFVCYVWEITYRSRDLQYIVIRLRGDVNGQF